MKQKNNRSLIVIIALKCFIINILALFTVKIQVRNVAVNFSKFVFLKLQQEMPTSTGAQLGLPVFCSSTMLDQARLMIDNTNLGSKSCFPAL